MLVLILGVGDATTTSTNKFQVTNIVADQHIKTNKQVVSTSGTTTTTKRVPTSPLCRGMIPVWGLFIVRALKNSRTVLSNLRQSSY